MSGDSIDTEEADFAAMTVHTLTAHENEVWLIQWSHDGHGLASASLDHTAIIWRANGSAGVENPEFVAEQVLRHEAAVDAVAWSKDDSILVTSCDNTITLWNANTGVMIYTAVQHIETVASLGWLPDDSGFVSGSMDCHVIIWKKDGSVRSDLGGEIRILDLSPTPDGASIVVIGLRRRAAMLDADSREASKTNTNTDPAVPRDDTPRSVILVYDLRTQQPRQLTEMSGELTSVSVSSDSRFALVNHAEKGQPELQLWDLESGQVVRNFTGQKQGTYVIRSCFGGNDTLVLSGSEDGKVYVWNREGTLLAVLSGHGSGAVNTVASSPQQPTVFASCSDDNTIRIWKVTKK